MSVLNMLRMLKFAKIMPVFAELALCKNMLKFSGIVKATQSELRQVHEIWISLGLIKIWIVKVKNIDSNSDTSCIYQLYHANLAYNKLDRLENSFG